MDFAIERAKALGAKRAMRLQVSGAFHSPLMEKTAMGLMAYMKKFEVRPLRVPWVANVTGAAVTDKDRVHDLLFRQLSSPVRWIDCMQTLGSACSDPVYEVGPGKVLAGLMKRINAAVEVRSLTDAQSVAGIV
ncbi:MAG: ACP S-malonyltransferase [Chitinivibrionia bacterium]|nr:ACP S-malonyltransferase [Chitinivibrionia bacterium]